MKNNCSFIATILCVTILSISIPPRAQAQAAAAEVRVDAQLQSQLEAVYMQWRSAMIKKNYNLWSQYTAAHKQITVKNRILSEKRSFPSSIFALPAAPPSVTGLKAVRVESVGATASAVYFGKVDFGVGGKPTDNVLQLQFVFERGGWKYSNADFFNLNLLKKERAQLQGGNMKFVAQQGFAATGKAPVKPIAINGAQYIAKVYVYCPGREVRLKVNKISDHRYQNNQVAEVVIGGARNGLNEISYAIKDLEGKSGKESLSIRVYLMSTVKGVKPIKVYEYQLKEGEKSKPFGTGHFVVGPKEVKRLSGK